MEYKYEGRAVCTRCKRPFDWYCVNLNLIPRNHRAVSISFPEGSHMAFSYIDVDNTPVFEGRCIHCGRITRLPKDVALEIPEKYYK